jgi:hypothetical protein
MAVIINWDSRTYNIIRIGFEGDWGWLGLRNKMRTVFALMQKSPTETDLIFDFTYSATLPANPIENFERLRYYLPANLGTIALVVPNPAMRAALLPICDRYAAAGLRVIISPTQLDIPHRLEATVVDYLPTLKQKSEDKADKPIDRHIKQDIHHENLTPQMDEWA